MTACTRAAGVAIAAVAACGDNVAPADAPVAGMADLAVVADQMAGTVVVVAAAFAADDCAIVEGCLDAPGVHRLLRFATVTANLGTADLVLGPVPPPGVSDATFVWSPCHGHHHVGGFASYELHDATGLVVRGHKQGFCIEDDAQVRPLGPSHGYSCNLQGISPGWADSYARDLPCQWIDVTSVTPGVYELRVTIDAAGTFPDSDRSNNTWSTMVTL